MSARDVERDEDFDRFIELFNDGEYELSHQALLPLWQQDISDDFFKGLIQLAGAFQHWNSGNAFWAEDLFASSHNLLSKYLPEHEGVDVDRLLLDVESCNDVARTAKQSGDDAAPAMPRVQIALV